MRFIPLLFASVLLLVSCERSPYIGYKRVADQVHLRLYMIGDGEHVPTDSDSVHIRLRMGYHGHDPGGLFSTERMYAVKAIRSGALAPVFNDLRSGDSMSVIAPAALWPWHDLVGEADVEVPESGTVQAELIALAVVTPAMTRAENERLKRNDPLGYERRLIEAFIRRDDARFERWGTSDMHYAIHGLPEDTTQVVIGDQITISYRGRRIEDGRLFDDTDSNGGPLSFSFGDKDQVMNGLEVAVKLLREGQEGEFIFPSTYAFGVRGIPGVLEAHTPVVYSVRLVSVARAKRPRRAA